MRSLVATIALILAICSQHVSADMERYLFTTQEVEQSGARCLDGSPSGFFYERGSSPTDWIVYLEGGGICETEESCKSRSKTALGSSTKWPDTLTGSGLLSSNQSQNAFYEWSHIYIPYCGGDLHSGQRRTVNEWNLYFSGHLTIVATVDKLLAAGGLTNATNILLSGESAGGIGAFEHIDLFADMFPHAHVRGSPQGGYYFPGDPQSYKEFVDHKPATPPNSFHYNLYNSSVDASCLAANAATPYLCGPANVNYLIKYITTPVYVAENQFDYQQIFERQGCPSRKTREVEEYVAYYGLQMWTALQAQVIGSQLPHGLYMPACLQHTEDLNRPFSSPPIHGVTYGQSLVAWYSGLKTYPYIIYDNQTMPNC